MIELSSSYGIDSTNSYEFAEGANQHLTSQRTSSSSAVSQYSGKAPSVLSCSDGRNGGKKDSSSMKQSKQQPRLFCEYCGETDHLQDVCPHKGNNETEDSEDEDDDDDEEEDV
jgi:hypothetical protein